MFFAVLFEREKDQITLHKLWNSQKMEQSGAVLKLNVDILAYQLLLSKLTGKQFTLHTTHRTRLYLRAILAGRCGHVQRSVGYGQTWYISFWCQSTKTSHILPLCALFNAEEIGTLEARCSRCKAARESIEEERLLLIT